MPPGTMPLLSTHSSSYLKAKFAPVLSFPASLRIPLTALHLPAHCKKQREPQLPSLVKRTALQDYMVTPSFQITISWKSRFSDKVSLPEATSTT